jgi:hypothetical protein
MLRVGGEKAKAFNLETAVELTTKQPRNEGEGLHQLPRFNL